MYNIHIQYNKYNSSLFASQIYCQWLTATKNQLYPHNTHTYSAKLSVNVISMEANQHHTTLSSLTLHSQHHSSSSKVVVGLIVGVWCRCPKPQLVLVSRTVPDPGRKHTDHDPARFNTKYFVLQQTPQLSFDSPLNYQPIGMHCICRLCKNIEQ